MKKSLSIIGFFIGIVYLPLAWYASYLIYRHIGATELMWFLFWLNIPLSAVSMAVGKMVQSLSDKELP